MKSFWLVWRQLIYFLRPRVISEMSPHTYYVRFKSLLRHSTKASKLYGIYRAQSARMLKFSIHEDKGALFEALSIQAPTITCQTTKKKNIRNIRGYFDGVHRNLIDKLLFKDSFMDYDVAVEFFVLDRVII